MKTFNQFITEANPPRPDATKAITKAYERRYKGMTARFTDKDDKIHVGDIWLPPHLRNKGIASRLVKGLKRHAVLTKKDITLRASPEEGKGEDLHRFYTRHGFEKVGDTSNYIRKHNSPE